MKDYHEKLQTISKAKKQEKKLNELLTGCVHSRKIKTDNKDVLQNYLPEKPQEKRELGNIVKTQKRKIKVIKSVKYTRIMLQRELEAQKEIEKKKLRVAPLYSKGPYQLIPDHMELEDLGKKK